MGQAHSHCLEHRGHGVGGKHPTTRSLPWTGSSLDLQELAIVDLARAVLAHRFERAHNREVPAVEMPRLNGSAIDEDCRDVHARDSDHGTGHVLVAPAYGKEP